jgi:hypothetical protein
MMLFLRLDGSHKISGVSPDVICLTELGASIVVGCCCDAPMNQSVWRRYQPLGLLKKINNRNDFFGGYWRLTAWTWQAT